MNQMTQEFIRYGKNCNILVYGPTNSGKTYTMLGKQFLQIQNESKTPKKNKSPLRTNSKDRSSSKRSGSSIKNRSVSSQNNLK